MSYEDEKLLLKALKKGDERAFLFLIEKYNRRLFGYAMSLTNDRAIAEDILQNVFLSTWEKRKNLLITKSIRNYLFRSVHNEFVDQYKKHQSKLLLEQKYFEGLKKVASTMDENRMAKIIARINDEIQNLPPKCQEVFLLSRKEGLTNLEISDYLDISVKTVETHITKAFKILRKKFRDGYHVVLLLLMNKYDKILGNSDDNLQNYPF
mgnify:CR=1 FL=1|jgi:RNA polymerase sigma-70 factor (ECF subfamily)|tara:strand:+ start:4815 stop:5438 length:624 start_codon:yes stop_codon:yes gene_type:complete